MKKNKKQEWGWTLLNYEEGAHGPFNSKKEVIKNAKEYIADESNKIIDDPEKILIGFVQWADPHEYLPDFDSVFELINQCAKDNEYSFFDDQVFDLNSSEKMAHRNEERATKELQQLLSKWTDKWITSSAWVLTNTEEMTIEK
jgi:hypothetical protein